MCNLSDGDYRYFVPLFFFFCSITSVLCARIAIESHCILRSLFSADTISFGFFFFWFLGCTFLSLCCAIDSIQMRTLTQELQHRPRDVYHLLLSISRRQMVITNMWLVAVAYVPNHLFFFSNIWMCVRFCQIPEIWISLFAFGVINYQKLFRGNV